MLTSAETRSKFRDFSSQDWKGDALEEVTVLPVNQQLNIALASMIEACSHNGLNVASKAIRPKLLLLAIAKVKGGCVVSIDDRPGENSMKSLCTLLNVPFLPVTSVTVD